MCPKAATSATPGSIAFVACSTCRNSRSRARTLDGLVTRSLFASLVVRKTLLAGRAQPDPLATGHCAAMSESAEGPSYTRHTRLDLNWRAQRGRLDAPSLYAAPYSRFERGGLYGCERQVRTCPNMTKPGPWRDRAHRVHASGNTLSFPAEAARGGDAWRHAGNTWLPALHAHPVYRAVRGKAMSETALGGSLAMCISILFTR